MDGPDAEAFAPTLAVAQTLGQALLVVGADGKVRAANERAFELGGIPQGPWTAADWLPRWGLPVDVDERPVEPTDWPLNRCLRRGESVAAMRLGFERPEGRTWLDVTAVPIPDTHRPGRRAAILLIEDVTRRHEDEQALRRARAVLASAVHASPLPMAVSDPDGRLIGANTAFERFVGRDGEPWWSFVDPADRDGLLERLRTLDRGPDVVAEHEVRGTDRTGEPVVVRVFAAPIDDTNGTGGPRHVSVQLSDVTSLRRSEARYRTLAESVPVGIFEMDRSGRFVDVTPLMEVQVASPGVVIGRHATDFVHPDDQARVRLHFARALAGRGSSNEYRVVHADGRDRVVLTSFQPVIGPGGGVESIIGAVLDITENVELQQKLRELGHDIELLAAEQARERLEAELAQAQRFESLGRLAGGVAHDFNNLLGVISNYAGFLAKRRDLPDELRPDVDQIARAAQRGAELTRQLLLFARREQLRPQRFDLSRTLDELGALMTRPLRPRIELAVEAEPGITIDADRGQIEQMVLNLLINARDALPSGGHITLRAVLDNGGSGPTVLLEVTDDGIGMPDEVRAHIFEPFFTTKPRSEASGLGLATVQGVVEQAGGTITVSSSPGEGTTFSVRLPACGPEPGGRA